MIPSLLAQQNRLLFSVIAIWWDYITSAFPLQAQNAEKAFLPYLIVQSLTIWYNDKQNCARNAMKSSHILLFMCALFLLFPMAACSQEEALFAPSPSSTASAIQRPGGTQPIITPSASSTVMPTHDEITPEPSPTVTFISDTFTKQVFDNMPYWLYTPQNPTSGMPLLIYLHGGSSKGTDLELLTAIDGFPQYVKNGIVRPNAYIIMPQLSTNYQGWTDVQETLMDLIAHIQTAYGIDSNRISLTGHSMGGTGVWQIALNDPDTFSCIAPLCGSVRTTEANLQKLASLPLWAFVGSADTIVKPTSSIQFVDKLRDQNPNARITVLKDADHFDVPARVYLDADICLVEWLISQSR